MRRLATLILGFVLLAPGLAAAQSQGSSECRHLTTQIDFFESRIETAEQLGNEVWVDRLGTHLDTLTERRADRCPGYGDGDQAMEQLEALLRLAAKGALTYFTFGAF